MTEFANLDALRMSNGKITSVFVVKDKLGMEHAKDVLLDHCQTQIDQNVYAVDPTNTSHRVLLIV